MIKDKLALLRERYLGTGKKGEEGELGLETYDEDSETAEEDLKVISEAPGMEEYREDEDDELGLSNEGENIDNETDYDLSYTNDSDEKGPMPIYKNELPEYKEPTPAYSSSYEIDNMLDSRDELEQSLKEFKDTLLLPDKRLSAAGEVEPVRESEKYDDGSPLTEEAKKFGFVRNKIDDWSDTLNLKNKAKEVAYDEYLKSRPKVLLDKYREKYSDKLRRDSMNPEEKAEELKKKISGGISKVGEFFGGSNEPGITTGFGQDKGFNKRIDMGAMMGISGSIFGTFGTNQRMPNKMMGMNGRASMNGPSMRGPMQNQMSGMGQNNNTSFGERSVPEKYMRPGIAGSQVPKYKAAPEGGKLQPGTTWTRVTKVDSKGKKRSYLRKSRLPEGAKSPNFQPGKQPQPQQQGQTGVGEQQPRVGISGLNIQGGFGGFGGYDISGLGKSVSSQKPVRVDEFIDKPRFGMPSLNGMQKEETEALGEDLITEQPVQLNPMEKIQKYLK